MINLEPDRDQILDLLRRSTSNKEGLEVLNNQRRTQDLPPISLRTLESSLSRWGFSRYAQLDYLADEIADLWAEGLKVSQLYEEVNQLLLVRGLPSVSKRTLERTLAKWDLSRQQHTKITPELINCVRFYFFRYGFSDQAILRDIQAKDHLQASLYTIRQIRWQNQMKRRLRTEEEIQQSIQQGIQFIHQDLQSSNQVRNFGRRLLQTYVRIHGEFNIAKNRLYDFYRQIFPEEVQRRAEGTFFHRTNYSIPGPNFMWCMDGYEKLKRFGFQIYACVDAYSRYIIWCYIGRSATTQISVLKQYLRTIQLAGIRPFFTRSDFGTETPLLVAAQAELCQATSTHFSYTPENIQNPIQLEQGNLIDSCHIYGPSTRNIRIESWWRQLRAGMSDRWIKYFTILVTYGLFVEGSLSDQIALYAIYGPIIRKEINQFVDTWNGHMIRTQKNRPHVVPGIPADLYNTQDTPNYGIPVNYSTSYEAAEVLQSMLEPLEEVEIDYFLIEATENWCTKQLEDMGFFQLSNIDEDNEHPFFTSYEELRKRTRIHIEEQRLPILQLQDIPTGGAQRYYQLLEKNYQEKFAQNTTNLTGVRIPVDLQGRLEESVDIEF